MLAEGNLPVKMVLDLGIKAVFTPQIFWHLIKIDRSSFLVRGPNVPVPFLCQYLYPLQQNSRNNYESLDDLLWIYGYVQQI